jgi:hypothetical protein
MFDNLYSNMFRQFVNIFGSTNDSSFKDKHLIMQSGISSRFMEH